ncbi:MAG: S8 family serine peptidase, partial [Methyloprofundus sp.]|nr:S8 family serine peptidase [Methyloprofundus sp.]
MKIMTYFPKTLLIIFFVIFLLPAGAQPPEQSKDNTHDNSLLHSGLRYGKMQAAQYSTLLNNIKSQQSVKVIIQLQSPATLSIENPGLFGVSAVKARALEIKGYQDAFIAKKGLQQDNKVKQFKHIPFLSLDIDEALLEELMQSEEVLSISEDTLNRISLDASIPYIAADSVWNEGYTGSNQTVAILDTGVDSEHVFLADPVTGSKVISEACYSTTYGPFNAVSLCSDGSTLPGAGANCTGYNGCYHGTHVAGIAAGDGADFSGVAKDASLIAIQVFSGFNDPGFCGGSSCIAAFTSDIIQGLERVYTLATEGTYSIAAVNMSLGGGGYTSVSDCDAGNLATKQIIDNLRSIGIATVIASGNESFADKISAPGCISSAISVGATNNFDNVASFSNSASWLSLLAPGVSITSSMPNDAFSNLSGTSMATPHVAGAFAVLKSKVPSATVDQLLAAMVNTGRPTIDSGNGLITPRIKLDSASDALELNPLPVNIILDNDFDGSQIQGEFGRVFNTQSYNGSSLEGATFGSNTFRFTPVFPQSGHYRVYGWWPAAASNPNDAIFTIKHDDGETQLNVNQQANGSQWYELGIFSFSTDNLAYVEISDANDPAIIADAVRFEFVPFTLTIESNILPAGTTGVAYDYSLSASGGVSPYTWNIINGSLPVGLSLQADGTIYGTPSQVGSSDFTLQLTDSSGSTAVQVLNLSISSDSNSGSNLAFEDDFESGTLAPWSQLQSGSIQLVNDPVYGGILRKVSNNDPNGGWAPLGATLNDFDLVLYTRKPNAMGGNAIRYSLTNASGNGYGITLSNPSGELSIEKRNAWKGSSLIRNVSLPEGMVLDQWYTMHLSRQGNVLSAAVYIGRVEPGSVVPAAELSTSDSTYSTFSQVNINGGYDFDTDNVRIVDLAVATPLSVQTSALNDGTLNTLYNISLVASGGASPYTWSVTAGTLPAGLSLQTDGTLSGSPSLSGTSNFTVQVTDNAGDTAIQALSLTITIPPLSVSTDTLSNGMIGSP